MSIKEVSYNNPAKRHFHTFDALRFFAFLKVFLLHLPIIAFPWFNYIKAGGGIGVQFFFVLSGFLITYIICEEKKVKGALDLKNFFVRRVLRIWPLYYLMVAVAYATPFLLSWLHLPSSPEGYQPDFWVSALFLENYKMMITHQSANVSPLPVMWSLCIEEHFYITWGLAMYFINIKKLPWLIISCIVIGIVCRVVYVRYDIPTSDLFTNIDLFAFGALPAYFLSTQPAKTEAIINKIPYFLKLIFLVVLLLVVFACSQYKDDRDFILLTTLLGLMFSLLIFLILPVQNRIRISDKNILSKIGLYTYGLYLYHTLVINFLKQVCHKWSLSLDEPVMAFSFAMLSLVVTIICGVLSYHLFEKHFLRLKKYFY